jgi:hypothetical protein
MRTKDLNCLDVLVLVLPAIVGPLAIIALALPDLVAWGAFLVLPFLILFPAPTLALYVVPFSLFYFAIRRWNSFLAALGGGLATVALTVGVPVAWNQRITAAEQDEFVADQPPRHPAQLAGSVTIFDKDSIGRNACGQLCTALLYGGKVREVTVVTRDRSGPPATFALQTRDAPCRIEAVDDVDASVERFLRLDVAAERALAGDCIVRRRAQPATDRWIVQLKHLPKYERRKREDSAAPARIAILYQRAGEPPRLVSRQTASQSRRLSVPLYVDLGGSPNSGARWQLGTPGPHAVTTLRPVRDFIDPASLEVRPPSPERLREALDGWLDQAELPGDQLADALMFAVLKDMKAHPQPGDPERLDRIVRDARSKGVHLLAALRAYPDRSDGLRGIALAHLAELPPGPGLEDYAWALAKLPEGAFAMQWKELADLARNRDRRPWLSPIIPRLADGGRASAETLFFLLDDGVDNPIQYNTGSGAIIVDHGASEAAAAGLCILGPAIAPAFDRVIRLRESPLERRQGKLVAPSQQWAVWQIRLGRPRDTIAPPAGAPRDWWRWVDERVAKADCTSN